MVKNSLLPLLLIALLALGAQPPKASPDPPEATSDRAETAWVDSTFQNLDADERLGQLFMIRAHSNLGAEHIAGVEASLENYHVGGLCFFQGSPEKQAELTNRYQALAKVPLMISMDAEWGLGMRLKSDAISFPYQLMLGAIQDNRLIYDMGQEVARQLRRLGVHVNFAPVADVNNNPENPVIGFRSFGEDRYNVTAKSYMYMKGLQDGQVMACAKHFPGHGDTDVDSHYDLPVISHSQKRLDSIELFPFRVLAEHGIQSMMVAHLHVPTIDSLPNLPTTLSAPAVRQLLQDEIGFDGLIFTDGLGMKGVTKHYRPGEVEAKALVAGNDVLLLPEDVPAAFAELKRYLREGWLSQEQVDDSVKKILRYKYRLGLITPQRVETQNIRAELNSPRARVLKRRLIENALTLVRNEASLLPLGTMASENQAASLASLSLGSSRKTPFQERLDDYRPLRHFQAGKQLSASEQKRLLRQLKPYDRVIVSVHDMSNYASKDFGVTPSEIQLLQQLDTLTEVVLVVFGNPYSLKYFDALDCVLVAYDDDEAIQDAAAQALYGSFSLNARLPVGVSTRSPFNAGESTAPIFRLGYDRPERVGMDAAVLKKIDTLAQAAVDTRATPGCVVLVAKDGQVVYQKSFGHHSYRKQRPTQVDDIYDLASLTKILSATLAIMKLQEQGLVNIYHPLVRYLPELAGSDKAQLTLQDIMAHRARLQGWIKFYERTLSRKKDPSKQYYRQEASDEFSIPVADKLFLRNDYVDDMWQQIRESPLRPDREYKYSDLGFYLIARLVKVRSGQSLDAFVAEHFYQPMGLYSATYNPWRNTSLTRVPPTEEDRYFRQQRVQGYVHDMGAAMLGGVSGHAGLFAHAQDVQR